MFTEKNFASALEVLNFQKISDGVYQKNFAENISMQADFNAKKLTYPMQLKNREKNNLLDSAHKENLVVFECVHRLLEKGYNPEHIELERAWPLGHDSKSGRGDICISNANGMTLCIVECKTFGSAYQKELKNLNEDGGQLFSYWQQERACKWLVLYTSTFDENKNQIESKSETVDCSDDKNILTAAEKNSEIKIYKNSYTVTELYDTWADTYEKKLLGDLFFNDDTKAYEIGVKPLKISDLKEFGESDGIVNKFEEILRHNNVSDKENAFNRLVALFICKLVDEIQNVDDGEVNFQYKIGSDTYEILQDRLQRLHRDGMEKFMDEKIFYLPDNYAENLIQQYFGTDRENMLSDLQSNLRKLKFFTNNDFAFKDVHNEELFYQNGKILVEVVRMFQNFRIIGAKNLQTLGDLFEQLLDKGFKQNEGQFFTPLPITRFIWDSLPLEKIISDEPPKIIDYACGAGHFLTQGFEAIKYFANNFSAGWEDKKLFGIEKDYRLARVSKISLFMHGANKGSIIFGDGLENNFDKYIRPADFDILVSNPPYSVKGFKPHLKLENKFDTLEKVSNDGSEIETLFVERISQLLKPGGVAAVILPSSVLNKDGKSFICAREKILQNFYVRAIAELGSKTFSATGTKTNIIFLEKLEDTPKRFNLLGDSVIQIFRDYLRADWEDKQIFESWLAKIKVAEDVYKKFIRREKNFSDWAEDFYFGEYVTAFENSAEYRNKIAQVTFQNLPDAEKISWLNQKFYDFAHSVEREKIHYFAMTYTQTTLIISAPDKNDEQEKFLGYTWSNRKGDEGIKIKTPGGLLYDEKNRRAENKLAFAVRKIFFGEEVQIPDAKNYFNYFNLSDLIDFSGTNFTKIIKLTKKIETTYNGKFEIISLGKAAPYVTEKISIGEIKISDYVTTDNMLKDKRGIKIFEGEPQISSVTKFLPNDILISNIRPYLKKIWFADRAGGCSNDVLVFRSFDEKILSPRYLFLILSQDYFFDFVMADIKGLKMPRGDKKNILTFKFPMPTLEEQKKIVGEFEEIDKKISDCEEKITASDLAIKNKFSEMFLEKNFPREKLGNFIKQIRGVSYKPEDLHENLNEKSLILLRANNIRDGEINHDEIQFVSKEKVSAEQIICEGDILISASSGSLNHVGKSAICSEKIVGETFGAFCKIIRATGEISAKFISIYFLTEEYREKIIQLASGANINNLKNEDIDNLKIPVPPKNLQEKFAEFVAEVESEKISAKILREKYLSEREALVEKYFR